MKVKFHRFYRGALIFLIMTWAAGLWGAVQQGTNQPVPATNQLGGLARTVEHLSENPLTFGLDRIGPLREYTFLGEPLWKYLASLCYVLLAFYVAKFIDIVSGLWLKKFARKTVSEIKNLLLDLIHGPIKVIAFVLLLNIGLNIFDWPERGKRYLNKGLVLVVAGSLTYLAIKVVDLLLSLWRKRSAHEADRRFNDQLFSVLRRSLNTFVVIVAVLVTAQNIGINITAALTSLSIGGLAVGLAAQDTLANLFGAVAVFADKPFRIGDQIKVDIAEGIVEDVGLRSTRVRSVDGNVVAVPNKTVGNAVVTRLAGNTGIRTVMNLVLPQTIPAAKVRRAVALLDDVYRNHPMTDRVSVSFNQFTGPNLNIQVLHWWKGFDYQQYLAGMQEMNLAIKERFEAEEIK